MPDLITVQDSSANPAPNLADRVRRAALDRDDRAALHWCDRTLSWSDLDAAVDAVARGLSAAAPPTDPGGTPPRVAIALPNTLDFVVTWLGALRAGLVAVPVNPGFTAPELRHVLADSGASVLIATDRVRGLVADVAAELPALTLVSGTPPTAEAPGPSARPRRGGADLAVLLYTSGTEGRPKGAMLSHQALLANHEQVDRIQPPVVGPTDTVLLALPLFHAYGLNSGLGAVVHHGATGWPFPTTTPMSWTSPMCRRAPTRGRSSCPAPTSSTVTGPTVGAAPTPTAGGAPATSRTPTRTVTSSWSTGSAS
ncbi:AMP-binding protein [Micromonospora zamorensis]|uniref:AMP-binding protein n=1 Tax=Micromonospora zamorensis TaxID=709883 RepID=UPI003D8F4D12